MVLSRGKLCVRCRLTCRCVEEKCRLIPPLNQLELLRNLKSKSGLTFRWAGASTWAPIPHGSMRASRGAQAGLRPPMAQDVHILLPQALVLLEVFPCC